MSEVFQVLLCQDYTYSMSVCTFIVRHRRGYVLQGIILTVIIQLQVFKNKDCCHVLAQDQHHCQHTSLSINKHLKKSAGD